jgi:hypothetical protein
MSDNGNGNTPQHRGLVDASSMFFARAVSIGRCVDENGTESALLVVAGNFGGDEVVATLHISIARESWPQFLSMVNRYDEVGEPPKPGGDES